jgi:hypothetical protein
MGGVPDAHLQEVIIVDSLMWLHGWVGILHRASSLGHFYALNVMQVFT